jgi:hypothetical protein
MGNLLSTIKESGKKERKDKSRKDVIYFLHNSKQPIGYIL